VEYLPRLSYRSPNTLFFPVMPTTGRLHVVADRSEESWVCQPS
jgi:hypothetical protein